MTSSHSFQWDDLPKDVSDLIISKLGIKELALAECVSKAFRAAVSAPELWANAPLDIRNSSSRPGALLTDAKFAKVLDRARGIPRKNISIIDLAECHDLTSASLRAISMTVDAKAQPPTLINVRNCGWLDSRELVDFLQSLEANLAETWTRKSTKLVLMSNVYKNDIGFLRQFKTEQIEVSDPAFEFFFDFWCKRGCRASLYNARFCRRCQVYVCNNCEIERRCGVCSESLCDECKCPDCFRSEEDPALVYQDQSDYSEFEESDDSESEEDDY